MRWRLDPAWRGIAREARPGPVRSSPQAISRVHRCIRRRTRPASSDHRRVLSTSAYAVHVRRPAIEQAPVGPEARGVLVAAGGRLNPNGARRKTSCTKVRARKPYFRPAREIPPHATMGVRDLIQKASKRCLGEGNLPHKLGGNLKGPAQGAREETRGLILKNGAAGRTGRHVASPRSRAYIRSSNLGPGSES